MITSFGIVWDWAFTIKMLPLLIKGAGMTVTLTAFAITFGTIVGLIIAFLKIIKNPVLNYLGGLYTWVFRGIPLLVQLFIIHYALPVATGINFEPFVSAVIGISLCGGAYIAESSGPVFSLLIKAKWKRLFHWE